MGMMTGEPRAATVTADTDVECYRLDKEAFRTFCSAARTSRTRSAEVLARRMSKLDAVREDIGEKRSTAT